MTYRILRIAEVEARTCLSKSTIYCLIREGKFPKSVPLAMRSRGWPEHEIDAWIEDRMAARETVPSGQAPGLVRHLRDRAGTG